MNQREIKFRAWHKADKQILPVIGLFYNPDTMQLMDVNVGDSEKVDWRDQSDVILMQYTGLKDKNGQEIYEGDVVKADGLLPSTIIFYESAFRTEKAAEPLAYDAERYGGLTVIGNIYEHPELLQSND